MSDHDKAALAQQAALSEIETPPDPEMVDRALAQQAVPGARELLEAFPGCGDMRGMGVWCGQVRAFLRTEPAAPAAPQVSPVNTPTHEHLSTMIGMVLGARQRGKMEYADGSVMDKNVKEAIEHLKDWPYPEPAAPQAEQQAAQLRAEVQRLKFELQNSREAWVALSEHAKNLQAALAAQQAELEPLSQAAQDVLAERQRQISVEGWTPDHDDEHTHGDMSRAAASYALETAANESEHIGISSMLGSFALSCWPWDLSWRKTGAKRRNLVKAGALILAEIERLDRAHGIGKEGQS